MNRRSLLLALLLVLVAVAAYLYVFRFNHADIDANRLATRASVARVRPSTESITPAQALVQFRNRYRLPVDRRFLEALAITEAFPVAPKPDMVRAQFQDGRWDVWVGGKRIGQMPRYPDFDDAMRLLHTLADERVHRWTTVRGNSPPAVVTSASGFDEVHLEYALFSLNQEYKRSGLSVSGLRPAAIALTHLAYLEDDQTGTSDALYAKALALVALSDAAGGTSIPESESLLASAMGYSAAAARYAKVLPHDDVWRLYRTHDDEALQNYARLHPQSSAAKYFWLRRLADMDRGKEWATWYRRSYGDNISAAALDTQFRLEGHTPIVNGTRDVVLAVVTGVNGPKDTELAGDDWIRAPANVIEDFDRGMASARQRIAGPYLTAEDIAGYYRGDLYSAYHRFAVFLIDQWGRPTDAAPFNALFESVPDAATREFHTWYGIKIASESRNVTLSQVIADMHADKVLGPRMYSPLLTTLMADHQADLSAERGVAQQLAASYDTRPALRADYAGLLRYALDLPGVQDIYASLSRQESNEASYYRLFMYAYNGDAASLIRVADDTRLGPDIRIAALQNLSEVHAPGANIEAAYRRLIQQHPSAGEAYADYIEFLRQQKDYARIIRVARLWLASQPADKNVFDFWNATIAVSDAELRLGKANEAWGALAPALFQPRQVKTLFGTKTITASTGYGKALDEGVKIALARGDIGTASKLAHQVSQLYGDSFSSQMAWLRVLWTQGKYPEAAQWLAAWQHPVSGVEWRDQVGGTFDDVFGGLSAKASQAFAALVQARVASAQDLYDLVQAVYDSGRRNLAVTLVQQIPEAGVRKLANLLTAYTWLKQGEGVQAAEAWLAPRLPTRQRDYQSLFFTTNRIMSCSGA